MKTRKLRYGLPYEPYIHEPELRFFEGELMGEQEPPPAQPRLFEYHERRGRHWESLDANAPPAVSLIERLIARVGYKRPFSWSCRFDSW